jgi:hypothetical protein
LNSSSGDSKLWKEDPSILGLNRTITVKAEAIIFLSQ